MNIIFFGNNWLGWKVIQWLINKKENIVGLVVHPVEKSKYRKEIISESGLNSRNIYDGSMLRNSEVIESIRKLKPDIGISVLFGYILKKNILDLFSRRCVNLHPSYLPYNRGAYPNVWSIIEGTTAGVTIHYIDERIDTGNIIAQIKVECEPIDTGESLYHKLEKEALNIFKNNWKLIKHEKVKLNSQKRKRGTYHNIDNIKYIDKIYLNRSYIAKDLINILRARTFAPYPGAYYLTKGRKIYLRLQLFYEDDFKK